MKKQHILFLYFFIICCFPIDTIAQIIWNDIGHIPQSDQIDWTNAGRLPGTPTVADTVLNVDSYLGSDNNKVQSALAAAKSATGTVIIYFPARTYTITSPIELNYTDGNNIVFQGDGSNATILNFTVGENYPCFKIAGTLTGSPTTLNSDIVKGSKNLSASSFSSYSDGNWIRLCEPNNPHVHESWAINDKVVGQITQLETVYSTTATMKDEASKLYITSYGTWIQRVFPIQNVGIENLKIKRLDTGEAPDGSNIYIKYAVNCWIKGVESDNTCRHHVMIDWSSHVEVSGCYFYEAESYGDGGYGYGVLLERSSTNCLIENNIFRKLRHAMMVQAGANCNVFEFNYSRDHYWTKWGIEWSSEPWDPPFVDVWPGGDISIHGNYPYANLFEYNYIERIIADGYHGANGPYQAFIRNLPYDDHSSFGRGWIILHDSPNSSVLGNKGGDNNNPPINTSGNTSLSVDLYGFEGGYEGAERIHNYYWSYGGWDDALF